MQATIHFMDESCAICGCQLHRSGTYATPTVEGRSHATKHHFVAQRFFGPNKRPGQERQGLFISCPWGRQGASDVFCYECHEELLHNPVLLPEDISVLAELARIRGLSEPTKTEDRSKAAGRVLLFHDVIARGLQSLLEDAQRKTIGGR